MNHKPFLIIGHQLPNELLPDIMDVEVIRQFSNGFPVYQLKARFNNYRVIIPFSPKSKTLFKSGEVEPAKNDFDAVYFEVLDLSNYVHRHNYKLKFVGKVFEA